jgi:hypothetical protein
LVKFYVEIKIFVVYMVKNLLGNNFGKKDIIHQHARLMVHLPFHNDRELKIMTMKILTETGSVSSPVFLVGKMGAGKPIGRTEFDLLFNESGQRSSSWGGRDSTLPRIVQIEIQQGHLK